LENAVVTASYRAGSGKPVAVAISPMKADGRTDRTTRRDR